MMPLSLLSVVTLDLVLGDPRWLPHPVRWIGSLVAALERALYPKRRSPQGEFAAGCILCISAVTVCAGCVHLLLSASKVIGPVASFVVQTMIGFYCLSARSLAGEANKVRKHLDANNIPAARAALSMIVGRDTENLEKADIVQATVETVAENITDGIISPLLYLIAGGPVAAIAFKAVSTMDSMIGYRNDRYRHFGTCAARFDDALNFIPARLTGFLLIPLTALFLRYNWLQSIRSVVRNRLDHESPNSAHGEAAVAGALGIKLGGGAFYQGVFSPRPAIGDECKAVDFRDIGRANRIVSGCTCIATLAACTALYFVNGCKLL